MPKSSLDPVDEPHTAAPPPALSGVSDDAVRAVRALIDAYRLSAESRDADVILDGILDGVARLVAL